MQRAEHTYMVCAYLSSCMIFMKVCCVNASMTMNCRNWIAFWRLNKVFCILVVSLCWHMRPCHHQTLCSTVSKEPRQVKLKSMPHAAFTGPQTAASALPTSRTNPVLLLLLLQIQWVDMDGLTRWLSVEQAHVNQMQNNSDQFHFFMQVTVNKEDAAPTPESCLLHTTVGGLCSSQENLVSTNKLGITNWSQFSWFKHALTLVWLKVCRELSLDWFWH